MKIRPYNETDKNSAIQLIKELQDYERRLESKIWLSGNNVAENYFDQLLKNSEQQIFLAVENDKIAGFCAIQIKHENDITYPIADYAYISDIIVAEAYRKQGFAKELLHAAEEYARKQGIKFIMATALHDNELSKAFFMNNGFRNYEIEFLKELE
jgi:ribosomal protein S18 acetylase RimI-like enzyme